MLRNYFSKHEVSGKKSNYSNTPPSTEDMTDEIICHTQSESTQRFKPEVSWNTRGITKGIVAYSDFVEECMSNYSHSCGKNLLDIERGLYLLKIKSNEVI